MSTAATQEAGLVPEYSAQEEVCCWPAANMMPPSVRLMPPQAHFTRSQRHVCIAGEEMVINMSTIQPYRKIIQHGG